MANLKINETTLEFTERGRGEPVVFVHGSASDYRTWRGQIDEFSKDFRVIAYSRRYHWPNAAIPDGADYSMMEHVDDLEALIRWLDIAPVHLVGHSYGAFVCLLLAIRAQDLISDLVLAEPPAITLFVSNKPKPSEILRLLVTRPRTAAAIIKFGARGVAPATAAVNRGDMEKTIEIFGKATLGAAAFDHLSESRLEQVRANMIKAELTGSGYPPLDDDKLRELQAPILLINAQNSPAMFHRLADRLEELLPDCKRVWISEASHIMHEDNPVDYNAAVRAFWKKYRGR